MKMHEGIPKEIMFVKSFNKQNILEAIRGNATTFDKAFLGLYVAGGFEKFVSVRELVTLLYCDPENKEKFLELTKGKNYKAMYEKYKRLLLIMSIGCYVDVKNEKNRYYFRVRPTKYVKRYLLKRAEKLGIYVGDIIPESL